MREEKVSASSRGKKKGMTVTVSREKRKFPSRKALRKERNPKKEIDSILYLKEAETRPYVKREKKKKQEEDSKVGGKKKKGGPKKGKRDFLKKKICASTSTMERSRSSREGGGEGGAWTLGREKGCTRKRKPMGFCEKARKKNKTLSICGEKKKKKGEKGDGTP